MGSGEMNVESREMMGRRKKTMGSREMRVSKEQGDEDGVGR